MIRTIIIDDEPSAVNVLSALLNKKCKEDVEVVASTNSPLEAKALIEQHNPDLVFLDIEMPGMNGIDLARSFINPTFNIVFVTAYDGYAIEAFKINALNYLLKPIGPETVFQIIERVKHQQTKNHYNLDIRILNLERLLKHSNLSDDKKIGIAMSDKIVFIPIKDIIYCQANNTYTIVYLNDNKKIVSSKPLGYFEFLLSNQGFFRIHHSSLINLDKIKEFQRYDGGYVIMDDNKQLEVSRRKRTEFMKAIDHLIA